MRIIFRTDYRVKTRQGTTPIESLKDTPPTIMFLGTQDRFIPVVTARFMVSLGYLDEAPIIDIE